MTKDDALKELARGNKIAHKYFTPDEWMMKEGNGYVFEDGCCCTKDEFWRYRQEEWWDADWRVVQ